MNKKRFKSELNDNLYCPVVCSHAPPSLSSRHILQSGKQALLSTSSILQTEYILLI